MSSSSSVRARVGEDAFKVASGGASCPESDFHNPNYPSDTAPAPRHRTPGRSSHASTCDHWTMKVPPLPAAELGHWLVKQIRSEPVGDRSTTEFATLCIAAGCASTCSPTRTMPRSGGCSTGTGRRPMRSPRTHLSGQPGPASDRLRGRRRPLPHTIRYDRSDSPVRTATKKKRTRGSYSSRGIPSRTPTPTTAPNAHTYPAMSNAITATIVRAASPGVDPHDGNASSTPHRLLDLVHPSPVQDRARYHSR